MATPRPLFMLFSRFISRIFDPAALNPGVRRREVLSWAGYDFANSGYTTVVLTAVFNALLRQRRGRWRRLGRAAFGSSRLPFRMLR